MYALHSCHRAGWEDYSTHNGFGIVSGVSDDCYITMGNHIETIPSDIVEIQEDVIENANDISALEQKTTDQVYSTGITRFSSRVNVKDAVLGNGYGTIINNDSVTME